MYAMWDQIWMYKVLCCLFIINTSNEVSAFSKYLRSNEICSVNNGKRIYLELGDKGVLRATNITTPDFLNSVSLSYGSFENVDIVFFLELFLWCVSKTI